VFHEFKRIIRGQVGESRSTLYRVTLQASIALALLVSVPFVCIAASTLSQIEEPSPVASATASQASSSVAPSPALTTTATTPTTTEIPARPKAALVANESMNWLDAIGPLTWSNWALAIFAAIAALIALRTLRAISEQARIANESLSAERAAAEAAKASADAAKAQTESSQKTLVLTQRPKLIVRNIVVKTPGDPLRQPALFQPGYSVEGEFQVVNVGGTPATITASGCWVFWNQVALPMHRPYDGLTANNPVDGILQPGTFVSGRFMSDKPMDQHAAEIFQAGNEWYLYVMGWVEYRDDLGFVRRTSFCRKYDVRRGRRFFAVDDPDYEHAD